VEIAAIVVWQVADTSRAVYAVDDYVNFVTVQAESALRHVATTHPYDNPEDGGTSLRGSVDVVAAELAQEVAQRVAIAGLEVVEVRISHLAYASEIAQAMLRRQQANAVVAARSRIVEGAVGMVEMALARLDERGVVELDEERKAAMVSNLLVVLCGDQPASPVVNTGSLYT
jgi:regulator of protease activity HflC (stomatin/prohibitin superfamily)